LTQLSVVSKGQGRTLSVTLPGEKTSQKCGKPAAR
jgi:hypothetical protein